MKGINFSPHLDKNLPGPPIIHSNIDPLYDKLGNSFIRCVDVFWINLNASLAHHEVQERSWVDSIGALWGIKLDMVEFHPGKNLLQILLMVNVLPWIR